MELVALDQERFLVVGIDGAVGWARLSRSAAGSAEISYFIAPEHRGRGHATWAARSLIARALADSRVHRVRACAAANNGASLRVLARCGFRETHRAPDGAGGWNVFFQLPSR